MYHTAFAILAIDIDHLSHFGARIERAGVAMVSARRGREERGGRGGQGIGGYFLFIAPFLCAEQMMVKPSVKVFARYSCRACCVC